MTRRISFWPTRMPNFLICSTLHYHYLFMRLFIMRKFDSCPLSLQNFSFIHSPTHPPTGGRRDKDKRVSPTRRCLCDSLANERFRFCPAETSEYSSSDGRACSLVLFALETVVMDGPSLLYRFCVAFAAAAAAAFLSIHQWIDRFR